MSSSRISRNDLQMDVLLLGKKTSCYHFLYLKNISSAFAKFIERIYKALSAVPSSVSSRRVATFSPLGDDR